MSRASRTFAAGVALAFPVVLMKFLALSLLTGAVTGAVGAATGAFIAWIAGTLAGPAALKGFLLLGPTIAIVNLIWSCVDWGHRVSEMRSKMLIDEMLQNSEES